MNAEEKTAYIEGVCDGFLMAPAFGAPNSGTKPLLQCISGMNNAQVTAIFDKYLAERPERWHVSANMLMHEALVKACKLATPKK